MVSRHEPLVDLSPDNGTRHFDDGSGDHIAADGGEDEYGHEDVLLDEQRDLFAPLPATKLRQLAARKSRRSLSAPTEPSLMLFAS